MVYYISQQHQCSQPPPRNALLPTAPKSFQTDQLILLFVSVLLAILVPASFSFQTSSTSLFHLKQIHARITTSHPFSLFLLTSLFRSCLFIGALAHARLLLDHFPSPHFPSITLWNSLIQSYSKTPRTSQESLLLFRRLLALHGPAFLDNYTFTFVVNAASHQPTQKFGAGVHGQVMRNGFSSDVFIGNSMVNFYAAFGRMEDAQLMFDGMAQPDVVSWTSIVGGYTWCGNIGVARELFDRMPDRNDVSWAVMMAGYLRSGRFNDVLGLFHEMLHSHKARPNEAVLVCVLSACAQLGALDQGKWVHVFIDRTGRAGKLEKAYQVVKGMPMDPDIIIWRALLSACRIHGCVDLGEEIINHIAQLDPRSHGGGYALISNLYASIGRWDNVGRIRRKMSATVKPNPGCSWIEVDGAVHEFLAADQLHPCIVEIRDKLNEVLRRISLEGGYIANTKYVLFELSEEEKEQAVSWHSEKLAVAFALMSTVAGSSIRIVKNLRICDDCHSAMKAISLVFNRDIVVRDRSRFHTFKRGSCSCLDYW
ncbi:hypothetical protein ACLOJK_030947 [Asimina triloba]